MAYLICGEAFLQPLDRATQGIVLHQCLAGLLPDLQLFVLGKGSLVPQTVTLQAGNEEEGGRREACQNNYAATTNAAAIF